MVTPMVPEIDMENVIRLQNQAPNLVAYMLPLVFLITFIEFLVSRYSAHKTYERRETFGNLLVGLGNLLVNLMVKTLLIYGAIWIYNALPWRMAMNWWLLIPCFVLYDFCSYWSHRISHFNRFFWATHVVHHSAEHYNLTVAFRQSWVQHFKTVFFIPVAIAGFHPVIFLISSQLSTLYQFWVHTEAIGKLHPFIEKYFGTPSNHRVHHGSQEKYLDKNFGATFMIWDHIFRTFQYEEEQPVYGLTTPLGNKTNPLVLNFHEYRDMITDIRQSDGLKECLFFIFASPGRIYRYKKAQAAMPDLKADPVKKIKAGALLLLIMLLLGQSVFAQQEKQALPVPHEKNLLFFLQRNPDANTVIYRLNYQPDGKLDEKTPVKGSWIKYAEKGKYQELTDFEKNYVYGLKCKALGNEQYELRLVAYQKMAMYLLKSPEDQQYHIYIKDQGRNLLLKRVFLRIKSGTFLFPKVIYIDLVTMHADNGLEILKRINL